MRGQQALYLDKVYPQPLLQVHQIIFESCSWSIFISSLLLFFGRTDQNSYLKNVIPVRVICCQRLLLFFKYFKLQFLVLFSCLIVHKLLLVGNNYILLAFLLPEIGSSTERKTSGRQKQNLISNSKYLLCHLDGSWKTYQTNLFQGAVSICSQVFKIDLCL